MNQLAIGQRAQLHQLDINENSPITVKFTRQSPIEIDISCFASDDENKLLNDNFKKLL